jgi:hypothetical protein
MVFAGDEMKDANSMTRDFIEVDDYATQLRAADSISKLKGHIVDKTTDINLGFSVLTDKQLQEIISGKMPKDIV